MSYDGNGNFLPLPSPTFPAVPGAVIYAEYFNLNLTNVHEGLSLALPRDGQAAMTGNLRMAGFQVKDVGAGTVAGDLVEWKQWTDTFLNSTYQVLNVPNLTGTPAGIRVPNLNWVTNFVATELSPIEADLALKSYRGGDTYTGGHNFSAATLVTLPATTTIGPVSAAELAQLDGVTSPIQLQLDSKGAKGGQVYTGTHDFTNGTLLAATLPAGTSTTEVATTAHVASVAFSSNLPGQSGKAGKFIRTDGTSPSWEFPQLPDRTVTGTTTAVASGEIVKLTNVAATAVTLPASPADGDLLGIFSQNLRDDNTVLRNGNDIFGVPDNLTIDNPYYPLYLRFRTGYGWSLA